MGLTRRFVRALLQRWAVEVHAALHASANGRMISEWAKKPECWAYVKAVRYSEPGPGIPEVR